MTDEQTDMPPGIQPDAEARRAGEEENALETYYKACLAAAGKGDWGSAFSAYENVTSQEESD